MEHYHKIIKEKEDLSGLSEWAKNIPQGMAVFEDGNHHHWGHPHRYVVCWKSGQKPLLIDHARPKNLRTDSSLSSYSLACRAIKLIHSCAAFYPSFEEWSADCACMNMNYTTEYVSEYLPKGWDDSREESTILPGRRNGEGSASWTSIKKLFDG